LFDDLIVFKFKHNKFITNPVNLNIRYLGNDKKKLSQFEITNPSSRLSLYVDKLLIKFIATKGIDIFIFYSIKMLRLILFLNYNLLFKLTCQIFS